MLVLSPFYKNKVRGWDISYIGRLFTKHNQICWGVKNNKKKSKTSSSLRPKSHDGLIYDNDMDWIIILKRYNNLPGKPCLVTILFRNEELINIMFRKDSSSASPFLHRCLRSVLMWMLASPVNCNLTSAMVILDKKDHLLQGLKSDAIHNTQGYTAYDLQLRLLQLLQLWRTTLG